MRLPIPLPSEATLQELAREFPAELRESQRRDIERIAWHSAVAWKPGGTALDVGERLILSRLCSTRHNVVPGR